MDVCIVCYYRQNKPRQNCEIFKRCILFANFIYWMTIIIVWLLITFGITITLKNIFMQFNIYKNYSFMLSISWFFIFISCPLHSRGILHTLLSYDDSLTRLPIINQSPFCLFLYSHISCFWCMWICFCLF